MRSGLLLVVRKAHQHQRDQRRGGHVDKLVHFGRHVWWLLPIRLAFSANFCSVALAEKTQLLSIAGVNLAALKNGQPGGQYLQRFHIKTWGVRVIAVCRIPGGWTIVAGKNANPEGELSGSAGEGVAYIDAGSLHELTDLFLLQIDGLHAAEKGDCRKNCTPATFAGEFFIGEYGSDEQPKPRRLSLSNVRLIPASKCPDPRPDQ